MTEKAAPSAAPKKPSGRMKDLSLIAPLFGFFLLIPPMVDLFSKGQSVFGAPMILVYLFGVWFGLIILAAFLSRRFQENDAENTPPL